MSKVVCSLCETPFPDEGPFDQFCLSCNGLLNGIENLKTSPCSESVALRELGLVSIADLEITLGIINNSLSFSSRRNK
jgi:hypothetical protein